MLKQAEAAALMKAVAQAVVGHVRAAVAPILDRIEALERRPAPERGEDGKPGADGKSITIDDVQPLIEAGIDKFSQQALAFMEAVPVPEPGKDGRDGVDGKPGADGKSVTIEDVAQLVSGKMAEWALDFERRAHDVLQRAIERVPPPKDGRDGIDGKDGADGLGVDDLDFDLDLDAGEMVVVFARGDVRREFRKAIPLLVDRGVFKADEQYRHGNVVTWGGSAWIAQKSAPAGKPGESPDWRLAVKHGRDGRDGAKGPKGTKGDPGESWVRTSTLDPA